jgi:hypothetical protein
MHDKYWFLATLLLVVGVEQASAQSANPFANLFGQSAPPTQAEWRKVARDEIGCIDRALAPQRTNVQTLAQQGVAPNDPRLSQVRARCRSQIVRPSDQPGAAPASRYVVDRLALGGRLQPDSAAYREYQCMPSEQFPGFTWCQKQRQEKRPGATSFANSILHSQDGTAVYLNRFIQPATFERGEIEKEIGRLSAKYGEAARVMRMPPTEGVDGTAVIAQWGQIELAPLDADDLADLATGKDVTQGLRVDYLGDFVRSAKLGLPVYRIAGGAGYLWAASSDQKGRGHLRLVASDASAYAPSAAPAPASPAVAQVANPDPPEQVAALEAAKRKAEADAVTPRASTEAAGAKAEDAKIKVGPDEAAPGALADVVAAKADSEGAQRAGAAADGAPAQAASRQAETSHFWLFVALSIGLIVILAGVAFLFWKRSKAGNVAVPIAPSIS